jgi:hypothetical protein
VETALPPDPGPSSLGPSSEPDSESDSGLSAVVPGAAELTSPVTPVSVPPITASPELVVPAYPDRRTGLIIFGVFQVILGLLAALMIPMMALGAFMSRMAPGGTMRPGQLLSGIATYVFIAGTMLTLGIGSMQTKRWAHAITLVTSWYWLIMGVLLTILLTAVLPVGLKGALAKVPQGGADAPSAAVSTGVMAVIITIVIIFAAFFLVIVPIAFVVFYGRKDVEDTCRHRDPVERWTDRSPLPVLGASIVLFTGALYTLLVGVTTPLFPFFGRYLTGIPAVVCFLVLAALDAYLAIALFRLQSSGWWITVVALPIRLLSMALTYAKADLMQAYSKVGFSDAQLQMLNSNPMLRSHVFLWWGLISLLLFFGYLLWLKRYFKTMESALVESPLAQAE